MSINSKFLLLIFLVLTALKSTAQNSGFLGKKTFVSAETRLFTPIWYNFLHGETTSKYKVKGDNLVPARNLLTYGFNFSLGRTIDRKSSFIFQFGILNFKATNELGLTPKNEYINKSSFMQGRSFSFMPILEFSGKDGLAPLGLSHQIGVGFVYTSMIEKDYMVIGNTNPETKYTNENTKFFDYNLRIRSYSLMYKINLRVPVSKRLLYNVGIRYNINPAGPLLGSFQKNEKFFSSSETIDLIRSVNLNNLVSLETGLTFMLF